MARRLYCRMFLILALLSLYISLKPLLITARTVSSIDFEHKEQELDQLSHLRHIKTDPKRRTRIWRMMSVEEINDYPGSGANNRHIPHCPEC